MYSMEIIKRDIESWYNCKVTRVKKVKSEVYDEGTDWDGARLIENIDTLKVYTNMKELDLANADYGAPEYENMNPWQHWLGGIACGTSGLILIVKVKWEVKEDE